MAKALDMPVVLVVNCRGLSLSVIPLIQGFVEYEHPRRIRGVILNQMSPSVYPDMKELIEMRLPVRVLGYVPRLPELAWESRHLGLVMPEEIKDLREKLGKLAGVLEKAWIWTPLWLWPTRLRLWSIRLPACPGRSAERNCALPWPGMRPSALLTGIICGFWRSWVQSFWSFPP